MALGTAALTAVASGGRFVGYITKVSYYHTYTAMLECSTGRVFWSNYRPHEFVPVFPLVKMASNFNRNLSDFIEPDSLSRIILRRSYRNNLAYFPQRTTSRVYAGSRKHKAYPAENMFLKSPSRYSLRIPVFMKKIDSLVTALSLSGSSVSWNDTDSAVYAPGHGRSTSDMDTVLMILDEYVAFASACRAKFNPALNGTMRCSFTLTKEGRVRKLKVIESTVNDEVMKHAVPLVISMAHLEKGTAYAGATEAAHTFSVCRNKSRQDTYH